MTPIRASTLTHYHVRAVVQREDERNAVCERAMYRLVQSDATWDLIGVDVTVSASQGGGPGSFGYYGDRLCLPRLCLPKASWQGRSIGDSENSVLSHSDLPRLWSSWPSLLLLPLFLLLLFRHLLLLTFFLVFLAALVSHSGSSERS